MTLLFVTRKVDRGDALAGFVITWLAALAKNLDRLEVICLEKGDASGLPANVAVHSMGKEFGKSRSRELWNYWRLLFRLLPKTDGVFIHMHPIYAIAAWGPARWFNKKMILWYTHKSVDFKLKLATALVDEVLTASPESFRLASKKVRVVGHGVDLQKFAPRRSASLSHGSGNHPKFQIISIGRISPVKDYQTFIKAAQILVKDKNLSDIEVKIYGKIGLPEHQSYLDLLGEFVKNAEIQDCVKFEGALNYEYVDEVYREADVFVNLSQTGSIDKTVLEAAASGILVLTSNAAFATPLRKISPLLFFEREHPEDLADKILKLKSLKDLEAGRIKKDLRAWVSTGHNLDHLAKKIVNEFRPGLGF